MYVKLFDAVIAQKKKSDQAALNNCLPGVNFSDVLKPYSLNRWKHSTGKCCHEICLNAI